MTYTIGGANPFKHVFGTIKNLNVTSSGRSYTETGIAQHIGGIVTVLETGGRIENCTMNGAITATYKGSDGAYVGGLVAYVKGNSSSIVGCENYASITVNGASLKYVGGLVGAFDISVQSTLSIDTSINFANINVSSGSKVAYVGGLVGGCDQDNLKAHAINITNCYNIGTIDVTSTGQQSVGGLFGRFEDENHATSITILNSYNAGFVNTSTTKQTHLGGLVGYGDKITIKNSFNIGKLYGYIDTSVAINLGGLVGYAYNSTTGNAITIEHSYNAGIINYVSGSSANKVGGLVGHLKSKDSNYNIGTTNYYVTNMGTAMGTAVGSKTVVTGSGRFDELYAKLKTPGESIYSTWSSSVWKRNQIYNNGLPFFATQPADTSTFTVEIKFNKGSGNGTMQSLYVYENSMFIAPKCTFSAPSGYYFEGWMTIPDGEEMEFGENSFVKNLTSNITLYPYWAEE